MLLLWMATVASAHRHARKFSTLSVSQAVTVAPSVKSWSATTHQGYENIWQRPPRLGCGRRRSAGGQGN